MKKISSSQEIRIFLVYIFISLLILSCGPSLSKLVKQKNYDEVKKELEEGSDPNKFDEGIGYPLKTAIKQKNIPMIELLIKNGADVNLSNPILGAIEDDDVEIVELLIRNGAKTNHSSQLSAAIKQQIIPIIELLIKNGAKLNEPYKYKSYEEGKVMGQWSFNIKRIDVEGTPLIEALYLEKRDEIIRLLINGGANVNAEDTQNKSPLVFAVEQERTDLVEYLLEKGANSKQKYTYISETKYLVGGMGGIGSVANTPINTYSSRTVLELAESKGYSNIVKLLKKFGATNLNKLENTDIQQNQLKVSGKLYDEKLSEGEKIYDFFEVSEKPVLIHKEEPIYPNFARETGLEGTVVVSVIVGIDGSVETANILKSIPKLDAAALDAAKKCKFKPAKNSNKNVRVKFSIPFSFKLDQ